MSEKTMTRLVRHRQGDPLPPEALEQLRKLANMPDEFINTTDIPERTSSNTRKEHVRPTPVEQPHKKAS